MKLVLMTPPILEMDCTVLMESIRNLKGNGSTRGKEARICSIEYQILDIEAKLHRDDKRHID